MKIRVGLMIALVFALAARTAADAETLTSFSDGTGKHLLYFGRDGHIHHLSEHPYGCAVAFCSSNWNNQDLSALTGVFASQSGKMTSFADTAGEHVFVDDGR